MEYLKTKMIRRSNMYSILKHKQQLTLISSQDIHLNTIATGLYASLPLPVVGETLDRQITDMLILLQKVCVRTERGMGFTVVYYRTMINVLI
jgi:hypothetical protein